MTVPIEWAASGRPIAGEVESGDAAVVETFDGGAVAAVIDGLGHGAGAAEASRIAVDVVRRSVGQPPVDVIRACHVALPRTRGVVMTIACFDARRDVLAWCGIGNVQGVLVRFPLGAMPAREALLVRGGVVGSGPAPAARASRRTIAKGDVIILATDGIKQGFAGDVVVTDSVDSIAATIRGRFEVPTDDALVLAVRYRGLE